MCNGLINQRNNKMKSENINKCVIENINVKWENVSKLSVCSNEEAINQAASIGE